MQYLWTIMHMALSAYYTAIKVTHGLVISSSHHYNGIVLPPNEEIHLEIDRNNKNIKDYCHSNQFSTSMKCFYNMTSGTKIYF